MNKILLVYGPRDGEVVDCDGVAYMYPVSTTYGIQLHTYKFFTEDAYVYSGWEIKSFDQFHAKIILRDIEIRKTTEGGSSYD